jgi:quinol monooxygenase YgiN
VILVLGAAPLRPDRRAAVIDATNQMQAATLTEPGCLLYRLGISLNDPNLLLLNEVWTNDEALQAHFATPHFLTFRQLLRDALSGSSELTHYEISRSSPLFPSPSRHPRRNLSNGSG